MDVVLHVVPVQVTIGSLPHQCPSQQWTQSVSTRLAVPLRGWWVTLPLLLTPLELCRLAKGFTPEKVATRPQNVLLHHRNELLVVSESEQDYMQQLEIMGECSFRKTIPNPYIFYEVELALYKRQNDVTYK